MDTSEEGGAHDAQGLNQGGGSYRHLGDRDFFGVCCVCM